MGIKKLRGNRMKVCGFMRRVLFIGITFFSAFSNAGDDLDPGKMGPPPQSELIDSRGIDMISGRHPVGGMAVSIGAGSSYLRSSSGSSRLGRDNLTASLTLLAVNFAQSPSNILEEPALVRGLNLSDGLYYQVDVLGYSEIFYVAVIGAAHLNVNGALTNKTQKGGSLTCSSTLKTCDYVTKNGDTVKFDRNIRAYYSHLKGHVSEYNVGYATRIVKADGEVLTYHYQQKNGYQSFGYLDSLPGAVVSSLGWMIKYSFNEFTKSQNTGESWVEDDSRSICAINLVKDYVDLNTAHCEQLNSSFQWPTAKLSRNVGVSYNGDNTLYSIGVRTKVTNPGSNPDDHYRSFGMLYVDQKETYTTPAGVTTTYDIGDYDFNSYDQFITRPHTGKLINVVIDGLPFSYGHETDPSSAIDDDNSDGIPEHFRASPDGTYEIDKFDRLVAFTNKMGARKKYQYHSIYLNNISRVDYPDGRYDTYTYDDRGNITFVREYPNNGSSPLVTQINYLTCTASNQKFCNKPQSVTTPNGATTSYTYYYHGGIDTITKPPVELNGVMVSPQIVHSYTQYVPYAKFTSNSLSAAEQPIWRLTKITQCRVGAICYGVNELVKTIHYDAYENLLPDYEISATGNGSVSLRTDFEYDEYGNLTKKIGPHPKQITYNFFDLQQRLVGTIGPDEDGKGRVGTYTIYNKDGQVISTKTGIPSDQTLGALQGMQPITSSNITYDVGSGLPVTQETDGLNVDRVLVEMNYDSNLRLLCKAVRVSNFSNADACMANSGIFGQDRITKYEYNALDQVIKTTGGYGTSVSRINQEDIYNSYGQLIASRDGKQNRTDYKYDVFGRASETWYPNPNVTNTSNSTDKIVKTYEGTRVKTIKLRNGSVITFTYDNWGRVILKSGAVAESFTYDTFNNVISHTNTTAGVSSTNTINGYYNAFGWKEYEQTSLGKVSYKYDAYGRRTELKWPDEFYVTYDYGNSVLLQSIKEGASTTILASYEYNELSHRKKLTRGNNVTTDYVFDDLSRVTSINTNVGGSATADDYQINFEYNPAGQIVKKILTVANQSYRYTPVNIYETYTPNGLNQIINWSGTSITHDANGNLTNLGSTVYGYNNDNLMTSAGGINLYYDAEKRLHKIGSTCFMYDGVDLIAETNCSGTVLNRYVHGLRTDDPIVWYVGTGTKNYYTEDYKGSVIGITNSIGNSIAINSYDEYGIPASSNTGRFQYTGQTWLSEIGLYYFKARFYHPRLGRFMQTDPIGYKDGMNWYSYVGNDPVNARDPSGMAQCGSLKGLECEAALKAANEARELATRVSEAVGAIANKLENGEELTKNEQEIVDAVKEKFGDKFQGASGLSNLSSTLSQVAGRIGGDGWGVMLNKGSDKVSDALGYVKSGEKYTIYLTSSFFKPHPMGDSRVITHEAAHLIISDSLYERYGQKEISIGIQRGEDMSMNADSYACMVHSEVANCN